MSTDAAIRRNILGLCERALATLDGRGIEKRMAIMVLVRPRWNHHYDLSDFQHMLSGKYVLSLAICITHDILSEIGHISLETAGI